MSTPETARRHVDVLGRRDRPALSAMLTPGVVYEMPQTRERIRGRANVLRFDTDYRGDWHPAVRRAVADLTERW